MSKIQIRVLSEVLPSSRLTWKFGRPRPVPGKRVFVRFCGAAPGCDFTPDKVARPGRIDSGTISTTYDPALTVDENHRRAAVEWCALHARGIDQERHQVEDGKAVLWYAKPGARYHTITGAARPVPTKEV